ncbi:hypothetical protein ACQP3F_29280, partial [Escherichia coli]
MDLKAIDKPAMICSYNHHISMVEATKIGSQGQLWLPSKFEANLDYMKPCLALILPSKKKKGTEVDRHDYVP